MTEFTPHEQQQIRDDLKASHRVLVEWQPERIADYPKYKWKCGRVLYETDADFAEWVVKFAPHKPGDRIPCDGGDVIVGDVWVQRVGEMKTDDVVSEGVLEPDWEDSIPGGPICTGGVVESDFGQHWDERNPSNPFASNPWVFVYDKLTWEAK